MAPVGAMVQIRTLIIEGAGASRRPSTDPADGLRCEQARAPSTADPRLVSHHYEIDLLRE